MRIGLSDRSRCLEFHRYDNHIFAEWLWNSTGECVFFFFQQAIFYTTLYFIAEIATNLTRAKRWDVNQRDSAGLTPLMWAARHRCKEVVKSPSLQKHTQPDIPDAEPSRAAPP